MDLSYLADHPSYVDAIAEWLHAEWGWFTPSVTLDARRKRLAESLNRGQLPVVFVAHEQGQLLGTASLRESDMDTRPELTPWLGGVLVSVQHRGRGIGLRLIRIVEDEALARGFRQLYLFTFDKAAYYANRGWTELERTNYRGEHVVVMRKYLSGQQTAVT